MSFLKSKSLLVSIIILILGILLTALSEKPADITLEPFPGIEIGTELPPIKLPDWIGWTFDGKDERNRKATFEFYTLIGASNYGYSWEYASSDIIVDSLKQESHSADSFLRQKLNEDGMRARIQKFSDVISIGASSCEGNLSQEQERSERRATAIRRALQQNFASGEGESYLLLLGQYGDSECGKKSPAETAVQRSVIVVGVVQKDSGVDIEEAVRDAMSQASLNSSLLESLKQYVQDPDRSPINLLEPEQYSLFDLRT